MFGDGGPAELAARCWPVRWVNRGGGCVLHLPGQLAIYPILALDRLGLGLQAFLDHLHAVFADVFREDGFKRHIVSRRLKPAPTRTQLSRAG